MSSDTAKKTPKLSGSRKFYEHSPPHCLISSVNPPHPILCKTKSSSTHENPTYFKYCNSHTQNDRETLPTATRKNTAKINFMLLKMCTRFWPTEVSLLRVIQIKSFLGSPPTQVFLVCLCKQRDVGQQFTCKKGRKSFFLNDASGMHKNFETIVPWHPRPEIATRTAILQIVRFDVTCSRLLNTSRLLKKSSVVSHWKRLVAGHILLQLGKSRYVREKFGNVCTSANVAIVNVGISPTTPYTT